MNRIIKMSILFVALILPFSAFCLSPTVQSVSQLTRISPYRQPVFYILVFTVIVLLGCILQLQKTMVEMVRYGNFKRMNLRMFNWSIALVFAFIIPEKTSAANTALMMQNESFGLGYNAFNALAFLISVEFVVILYYIRKIHQLMFLQTKS
jgi:hypothetical protein